MTGTRSGRGGGRRRDPGGDVLLGRRHRLARRSRGTGGRPRQRGRPRQKDGTGKRTRSDPEEVDTTAGVRPTSDLRRPVGVTEDRSPGTTARSENLVRNSLADSRTGRRPPRRLHLPPQDPRASCPDSSPSSLHRTGPTLPVHDPSHTGLPDTAGPQGSTGNVSDVFPRLPKSRPLTSTNSSDPIYTPYPAWNSSLDPPLLPPYLGAHPSVGQTREEGRSDSIGRPDRLWFGVSDPPIDTVLTQRGVRSSDTSPNSSGEEPNICDGMGPKCGHRDHGGTQVYRRTFLWWEPGVKVRQREKLPGQRSCERRLRDLRTRSRTQGNGVARNIEGRNTPVGKRYVERTNSSVA